MVTINRTPSIISKTYEDDGTPEGIHISTLGCAVTAVYVDPEHNACLLVLPGMACTDMNGAIDLAKILLPSVSIIATCNELGWDTSYVNDQTHEVVDNWECRMMKKEDSDPQDVEATLMGSAHCLVAQDAIVEALIKAGGYALRDDFFEGFKKSRHNQGHIC